MDVELDLFESLPELEAELNAEADRARAVIVRARVAARRSASEEVLATVLPPDIADGDAWHVISSGDVDALSFLAHLLATHDMDHVVFSTWCMAIDDVERVGGWLERGRIRHVDAYVGEIFPGSYTREFVALSAVLRAHGGRICVFRNHSKVFLCRSGDRHWVIESSANINTNPRTENTVITADRGLYEHHRAYFDGITSFDRSFDDWLPAP